MSYTKLGPNLKINVESTDCVMSISTIWLLLPHVKTTHQQTYFLIRLKCRKHAYNFIYALEWRGILTAQISLNWTELNSQHTECHQNQSAKHDCRWVDFHGTHTGLTTFALNIRITICTNIRWAVQIMKTLIMQSSPLPCYLVPFTPNIFLSTLFSNTLSLYSSFNVRDQVSHPHKTKGNIMVLYISNFMFLDTNWKTKDSAPKGSKHSTSSACC